MFYENTELFNVSFEPECACSFFSCFSSTILSELHDKVKALYELVDLKVNFNWIILTDQAKRFVN